MIESLGILLILGIIAIITIPILLSIFWILMLIHCATREFKNKNDKIVWILIIIFLHIVGAMVYYFVIKRKEY
jgi:formate hydrogenlyase subunit 3/multisubunit Na+/H+ antiporter MnhD subunit